jgi:hypothetical protein
MIGQFRTWFMIGSLTLAAVGAASAQAVISPSPITTDLYQPQMIFDYRMMPRVVYVPVAVAAQRPPVELIATATVILQSSAPLGDVRVKPGTVVIWTNGEDHPRTLVLEQAGLWGASADRQESGAVPAASSVSLAFNQPGIYRYYMQDKPAEIARLIVGP